MKIFIRIISLILATTVSLSAMNSRPSMPRTLHGIQSALQVLASWDLGPMPADEQAKKVRGMMVALRGELLIGLVKNLSGIHSNQIDRDQIFLITNDIENKAEHERLNTACVDATITALLALFPNHHDYSSSWAVLVLDSARVNFTACIDYFSRFVKGDQKARMSKFKSKCNDLDQQKSQKIKSQIDAAKRALIAILMTDERALLAAVAPGWEPAVSQKKATMLVEGSSGLHRSSDFTAGSNRVCNVGHEEPLCCCSRLTSVGLAFGMAGVLLLAYGANSHELPY